jgi:ABC-type nitrate/sulfonate/bicarbonate transport system substrate-binding protein
MQSPNTEEVLRMTHSRDVGTAVELRETTGSGRNVIAAIGIDRYRHWQQLTNAVRDARGTLELFHRLGFEEITKPLFDEAATSDAVHRLVTDDLAGLGSDDSLVLFYAGHGTARNRHVGGHQVKTGCLLGSDASATKDCFTGWIDLDVWLHEVALLPARHILVVLDACESGIALEALLKWRASGPAADEPLPALQARRSRRVITSAMHGQVALDSGPMSGHSLFTGCMIEGLTRGLSAAGGGVATGSALGLYVQQRVQSYPRSRQTPDFGAFEHDDRGEIVIPLLTRPSAAAMTTISLPRPDGRDPHGAGESGVYIGWVSPQAGDDGGEPARRSPRDSLGNQSAAAVEVDRASLGTVIGGSAAPTPAPGGRSPRSPRFGGRSVTLAIAGLVMLAGCVALWSSLRGGGNPPPIHRENAVGGGVGSGSPARGNTVPARRRIVVGVNDFGGAYAGIVANDGLDPGPNSLFARAGLDVEIRWVAGSKERRDQFDSGKVDIMLLTLDYLANLAPEYHAKNQDVKAFLMVDWSRGNLGIIATPEIHSIEDLKNAKIATTIRTPTHYLLLTLLEMSSLSSEQVTRVKQNIEPMAKTPEAGPPFTRKEMQAVALWEPYLSRTLARGDGHLLISTATASHLVADVLFARDSFLTAHEAEMTGFVRAWLAGGTLLADTPERWVPLLAAALNQAPDTVRDLIRKTRPATFVDNREFFGLERARAAYFDLFDNASRLWLGEGVIEAAADARATRWMKPLEALLAEHAGDSAPKEFHFAGCPSTSATPLLTRNVSIHFATSRSELDAAGEQALDDLSKIVDRFGNACIRVVGHTDGTGAAAYNKSLSEQRAAAAVTYLSRRFEPARFQPLGAGAQGRAGEDAANRRTDFQILVNDCAGTGCPPAAPSSPSR